MFIPIPLGQRHIVTATGSAPKLVHCESCSGDYVYFATVAAQGEGFSPLFLAGQAATDEAEHRAKAKLAEELAKAVQPIPCPTCGWYQHDMVAPARELRYAKKMWLCKVFGGFSVVMILPFLLLASPGGGHMIPAWGVMLSATPAAAFAALFAFFARQSSRFDPNSVPQPERMRVGKTYALPEAEFRSMLSQHSQAQDQAAPHV